MSAADMASSIAAAHGKRQAWGQRAAWR